MRSGIAPDSSHTGMGGLCEQIRGSLAGWAPRLLGVHDPGRHPARPAAARLVGAVADAAELTALPRDAATARAELHTFAARASAACASPNAQGSDADANVHVRTRGIGVGRTGSEHGAPNASGGAQRADSAGQQPFVWSAVISVMSHVSPSNVAWDLTGYFRR